MIEDKGWTIEVQRIIGGRSVEILLGKINLLWPSAPSRRLQDRLAKGGVEALQDVSLAVAADESSAAVCRCGEVMHKRKLRGQPYFYCRTCDADTRCRECFQTIGSGQKEIGHYAVGLVHRRCAEGAEDEDG